MVVARLYNIDTPFRDIELVYSTFLCSIVPILSSCLGLCVSHCCSGLSEYVSRLTPFRPKPCCLTSEEAELPREVWNPVYSLLVAVKVAGSSLVLFTV